MKVKSAFWMLLITFLAILHSHSCNGRTAASEQQLGLGQQPLIQLSHDDSDDDYLDIKDEIHLEDFFWTGSGDGPPDYLKKVHTGISKGKDVIVKTETVVATVYVDGNNEIDIPICLDCRPDDGGGTWDLGAPGMPPLNYSSTDRRYWLLTVVSGFYTAKDNPILEEKLARLYRLAFTRQQTRHLGINGAQQIEGVLEAAPRERRKSSPLATTTTKPQPPTDSPSDEVEILDMAGDEEPYIKTVRAVGERSEWSSDSEEEMDTETETPATSTSSSSSTESVDYSAYVTLIPWELIQQNGKSEKLQEAKMEKQQQQQPQQAVPLYRDGRVRVVIHNLTQISEADVQNWSANTNGEAMEHVNFVNLKFNDRPIANQTELIYTVLVNGRPVLATTAAKDMELVSEAEAVSTFGQAIYMKSEPYIREPTATALAPVPRSGQAGFFNSVKNNVALVVISSLAILLLMLLLLAVLLLGRTRARQRELSAVNRNFSRNELLSEGQSMRPSTTEAIDGDRDVGVQNFSYEREPRISFPAPPVDRTHSRSRQDSISSTDNTSDSSVYCPINPPSADVQRILDDKAARLFDAHKRRHQYDRAEGHEDTVYTSVVSEKKGDKSRHKSRRRYLNENRVGSLETSPVQGSLAGHSSAEEGSHGSPDALRRSYENFQRNEAYNLHNNYHRNKLLKQQQSSADKKHGSGASPEAINNEIIRTLQPSDKSSDTASVGSFLSMASVRAFPKNTLPEPLNRVLDPVFVTYYDNVNAVAPKPGATHSSQRSLKSQKSVGTIAAIASFPSPKAPPNSVRNVRSAAAASAHSDNPDPGVIGPVVWERHKKRLAATESQEALAYADYNTSPFHNPSAIRNHYEGLLEGALQMYASQDDIPMPLPTHNFTNSRRAATNREHRGSSAGLPSFYPTAGSRAAAERPATAQPEKTTKLASTQPPSPTHSAWGGGSMYSSHSTLNRPLSAGNYHREEDLYTEVPKQAATSSASASAAPLIEAIQTELRKFKQRKD